MKTYTGSCHCGAVRFQVALDAPKGGRCNCSICTKVAQTGAIVKPDAFRILAGEDSLSVYAWGMKISHRHFCKTCGIQCFGKGHLDVLGGDYVSVNLNCIDGLDPIDVTVEHWDGRHDNWEAGPRATPWPI